MKKRLFPYSFLLFLSLFISSFSPKTASAQTCSQLSIGLGTSNTSPCLNSSTSFWKIGDWQLQNNVKWFVDNVQVGTGSNLNYTFTTSGSHVVKIEGSTSDNSCTKSNTLTVNVASNVGAVSGLTTVNAGQQGVVYSLPNATGSFNWYTTTDAQIVSGQGTNTITVNFGNGIGNSFQVVAQGSCNTSTTLNVQKSTVVDCSNLPLGISVSAQPPCINQSTVLGMTGNYQFQDNLTWFIDNVQVGTGQSLTHLFSTAGTYTVKLIGKTSGNSCTKETSTTLTVLPTVGPISGPTTVSPNSNQIYSVPNMGSGTYNWWYDTDAQITSGQNTPSATYHFGNSITNSFTITVGYTSTNGCHTERSLTINKGIACVDSVVKAYVTRNQLRLRAKQNFNPNCKTRTEHIIGDTAFFNLPASITLSRPVATGDKAYLVVQKGNFLDTIRYQSAVPQGNDLPFASSTQGTQPGNPVATGSVSFWIEATSTEGDVQSYVVLNLTSPINLRVDTDIPSQKSFVSCQRDSIRLTLINTYTPTLSNGILALSLNPDMQYLDFKTTDFGTPSQNGNIISFNLTKTLVNNDIARVTVYLQAACSTLNKSASSIVDKVSFTYLNAGVPVVDDTSFLYNISPPQFSVPVFTAINASKVGASIGAYASQYIKLAVPIVNTSIGAAFTGRVKVVYSQDKDQNCFAILNDSIYVKKKSGIATTATLISKTPATDGKSVSLEIDVTNLGIGNLALGQKDSVFAYIGLRASACGISQSCTLSPKAEVSYGCSDITCTSPKSTPTFSLSFFSSNASLAILSNKIKRPGYRKLDCSTIQTFRNWEVWYVNDSDVPVLDPRFFVTGASNSATMVPPDSLRIRIIPSKTTSQPTSYLTQKHVPKTYQTKSRQGGFACSNAVPTWTHLYSQSPPSQPWDSLLYVEVDKIMPKDTVVVNMAVYNCCPTDYNQYATPNGNRNTYFDLQRVEASYQKSACDITRSTAVKNYLNVYAGSGQIQMDIQDYLQYKTVPAYDTFDVRFTITKLWKEVNTTGIDTMGRFVLGLKFSDGLTYIPTKPAHLERPDNNSIWWNSHLLSANTHPLEVRLRDANQTIVYWDVTDTLSLGFDFKEIKDLGGLDAFTTNTDTWFQFGSYCPKTGLLDTNGYYAYTLYYQPNKNCTNCLIPLNARSKSQIIVNCPGCKVPGSVTSAFVIQRLSAGYKDTNANGLPDQVPPKKLSPDEIPLESRRSLITGDTLAIWGTVGMNKDSLRARNLPFIVPYLYAYHHIDNGGALKVIKLDMTITIDGQERGSIQLSPSDAQWPNVVTSNASGDFFFDFSIPTLTNLGLNVGDRYSDSIRVSWNAHYYLKDNLSGFKKDCYVDMAPFYTGISRTLSQTLIDLQKTEKNRLCNKRCTTSVLPTDKTKYLVCETSDGYLNMGGYKYGFDKQGDLSSGLCGPLITEANFISINATTDYFPSEYRPAPVPDTIYVHWRAPYTLRNIDLTLQTPQNYTVNNVSFHSINDTLAYVLPRKDVFRYQTSYPPSGQTTDTFLAIPDNTTMRVDVKVQLKQPCGADTTLLPNISYSFGGRSVTKINDSLSLQPPPFKNKIDALYRNVANLKAKLQDTIRIHISESKTCLVNSVNNSGLVLENGSGFRDPKLKTSQKPFGDLLFFNAYNSFLTVLDRQGNSLVEKVLDGTDTTSANKNTGIVYLRDISAGTNSGGTENKPFLTGTKNVCLNYQNCQNLSNTLDTLKLVYGWACDTVKSMSQCTGQKKQVTILATIEQPTLNMTSIVGESVLPSCAIVADSFTVFNEGKGRINRLLTTLSFDKEAIDLQSPATITYQTHVGKNKKKVSYTPLYANGLYSFDTELITALKDSGVKSMTINFRLKTSCDTKVGTVALTAKSISTSFCGSIDSISKVKNFTIPNSKDTDTLQLTGTNIAFNNCADSVLMQFIVKNTGKQPTVRTNELKINYLPSNYYLKKLPIKTVKSLAAGASDTLRFYLHVSQNITCQQDIEQYYTPSFVAKLYSTLAQKTCPTGGICPAKTDSSLATTITIADNCTRRRITGDTAYCPSSNQLTFSVPAQYSQYQWTVPFGSTIASGQNTAAVTVNMNGQSGYIKVKISPTCERSMYVTNRILRPDWSTEQLANAKSLVTTISNDGKPSHTLDGVYRLTENLVVGGNLTINPGTVIYADSGTFLQFAGSNPRLDAKGMSITATDTLKPWMGIAGLCCNYSWPFYPDQQSPFINNGSPKALFIDETNVCNQAFRSQISYYNYFIIQSDDTVSINHTDMTGIYSTALEFDGRLADAYTAINHNYFEAKKGAYLTTGLYFNELGFATEAQLFADSNTFVGFLQGTVLFATLNHLTNSSYKDNLVSINMPSYFVTGTNVISNTIHMTDDWVNARQMADSTVINPNYYPNFGYYVDEGLLKLYRTFPTVGIVHTGDINARQNTIIGKNTNPHVALKGIMANAVSDGIQSYLGASGSVYNIRDNHFQDLDTAIYFLEGAGHYSTTKVTNNTFQSVGTAIVSTPSNNSYVTDTVRYTCNNFIAPSSGAAIGILFPDGAAVNDLGSLDAPAGNVFTGYGGNGRYAVVNNNTGTGTAFTYYYSEAFEGPQGPSMFGNFNTPISLTNTPDCR